MLRFRALHLLLWMTLLVGFASSAQAQEEELYFEDFRTRTFDINRAGPAGVNQGQNNWIINRRFQGGGTYPNTPAQSATAITRPNCDYLHIRDNSGGANGSGAVYSGQNASDRFTRSNAAICTRNYTNVSVSFWWMGQGSAAAWAEMYYSRNGGNTWTRIERTPGNFRFNNQATWTQETVRLPEFNGAGDLRIGFRWVNTPQPGIATSFAVDDIRVVGTFDEANPPKITVELDSTEYCRNNTIVARIMHDKPFCGAGTYTIEISNARGTFDGGTTPLNFQAPFNQQITTEPFPVTFPATLLADLPSGTCLRVRVLRTGPSQPTEVIGEPSACFQLKDCPPNYLTIRKALFNSDGATPPSQCNTGSFAVNFQSNGQFQAANEYVLELSNAAGAFANPQIIGRFDPQPNNAQNPQTAVVGAGAFIDGEVPGGIAPGCNYFIRIASTAPRRAGESYGPFCFRTCDIETNGGNPVEVCLIDGEPQDVEFTFGTGLSGGGVTYPAGNQFVIEFARQEDFRLVTEAVFPGVTTQGILTITLPSIPDLIDRLNLEPGQYYVRVASTRGSDAANRKGSWVAMDLGATSGTPLALEIMTPDLCAGQAFSPVRIRVNGFHPRKNSVYALFTPQNQVALVFDQATDLAEGGFIEFGFNTTNNTPGQQIGGFFFGEFNGACQSQGTPLVFNVIDCNVQTDPTSAQITALRPVMSNDANRDTVCVFSALDVRFTATGNFNAGNQFIAELSGPDGNFTAPILLGALTSSLQFSDCDGGDPAIIYGRVPLNQNVPAGCNYFIRVRSTLPTNTSVVPFGPFCIKRCDIESNYSVDLAVCATNTTQEVEISYGINSFTKRATYRANNEFYIQILDKDDFSVVAERSFNGSINATGDSVMTLQIPSFDELVNLGLEPNTLYYLRVLANQSSVPTNQLGSLIRFAFTRGMETPIVESVPPGDTVCFDPRTGLIPIRFKIKNPDFENTQSYQIVSPLLGGPITVPVGQVNPQDSTITVNLNGGANLMPLDFPYQVRAISSLAQTAPLAFLTVCNSALSTMISTRIINCITNLQVLTLNDDNSACAGSAFDIEFEAPGNYFADNLYSIELSNANGSFGNFRVIGTDTLGEEVAAGVIRILDGIGRLEGQLPADLPEGENYFVRVRTRRPSSARWDVYGPFTIRRCDIATNELKDIRFCVVGNSTRPLKIPYKTGNRMGVEYNVNTNNFGVEILEQVNGQLETLISPGTGAFTLRPGTTSGEFDLTLPQFAQLSQPPYSLQPNTTYYLRVVATAGDPAELVGGTLVRFRYTALPSDLIVTSNPDTFCLPSLSPPDPNPIFFSLNGQITGYDANRNLNYRATLRFDGRQIFFVDANGNAIFETNSGTMELTPNLINPDGSFTLGQFAFFPEQELIPFRMTMTISTTDSPFADGGGAGCTVTSQSVVVRVFANCIETLEPHALINQFPKEICVGSAFDVPFAAPGIYPADNRFRLQISRDRDFLSGIRQLASIKGNGVLPNDLGLVEAMLPDDLTPGTYFARVISTLDINSTTAYGPFEIRNNCGVNLNKYTDLKVCIKGASTTVNVPFTPSIDGVTDLELNYSASIYLREDMSQLAVGEFGGNVDAVLAQNQEHMLALDFPSYDDLVNNFGLQPNVVHYLHMRVTNPANGNEVGQSNYIRFIYSALMDSVVIDMLEDTFCLGELPTNAPQTIQFYTYTGRIRNYDARRNSDYLLRAEFFGLSGFSGEFLIPAAQIRPDGTFSFADALNRHPAQGRPAGFEPLRFNITMQEIGKVKGCDSGAVSNQGSVWLTNCTRIPAQPVMLTAQGLGDTLCNLSVLDVNFRSLGVFPSNNEYVLQLSDSSGSFAMPRELARIPGGDYRGGGIFRTTMPANVPEGNNYRLRVATTRPTTLYFPSAAFAIKKCDILSNFNNSTNLPEDLVACVAPGRDTVTFNIPYRTQYSGDNVTYAANNEFRIQILSTVNFAVISEGLYGATRSTTNGTIQMKLPFDRELSRVNFLIPNTNYYLRVFHTNSNRPEHRLGSLIRFTYSVVDPAPVVLAVRDTICLNENPELPVNSQQVIPLQYIIRNYDRSRGTSYRFQSNIGAATLPPGSILPNGTVNLTFTAQANILPVDIIATFSELGANAQCNQQASPPVIVSLTNCVRVVQPFGTRAGESVCAGSAFDVRFMAPGNYPDINTFILELSNASGSFANPVRLDPTLDGGGLVAAVDTLGALPVRAGEFQSVIPRNTPAGDNYRVRVRSTQPVGRMGVWGPFSIQRCNILTDSSTIPTITLCLFEDEGDTLVLDFKGDLQAAGVTYGAGNRFVVDVLERTTMRLVTTAGPIAELTSAGPDGTVRLIVPTPRILQDLGVEDNEMYYLRIRPTASSVNNDPGTLVRFAYTFRQRELLLEVVGGSICIKGSPIVALDAQGRQLIPISIPLRITNFDPTKDTDYEITFSFAPNNPITVSSDQINVDGTITVQILQWIFQDPITYTVDVQEVGAYTPGCRGEFSVGTAFNLVNCTEVLQPVMERASIYDTVCAGSVFDVPFDSYGLFAFANVFEVHLSDENGMFDNQNPRVLGTLAEFIPQLMILGGPVGFVQTVLPDSIEVNGVMQPLVSKNPSCNFYMRIVSNSSGLTELPHVVPFGPFCIRNCDINTNNSDPLFSVCVSDGDTTRVELPYTINNHDLNSVYDEENYFSAQVLDGGMNILVEGDDFGQVRSTESGNIELLIPPFRELADRFNINTNGTYYMRVTATSSSRMYDILGTLVRFSVASLRPDKPVITMLTPDTICLDGAVPIEFLIGGYDPSKPTRYEVRVGFDGRSIENQIFLTNANIDADGVARLAWAPPIVDPARPLPTLQSQSLSIEVREAGSGDCEGGEYSVIRQFYLVQCINTGAPVASNDQAGDTLCLGSAIDLAFTSVGAFERAAAGVGQVVGDPINNYVIELSDTTNNFRNRTRVMRLGQLNSVAAAGLISGYVPSEFTGAFASLWPASNTSLTKCDFRIRVASTAPIRSDTTSFGPFCLKKCNIRTNNRRDTLFCIAPADLNKPVRLSYLINDHSQSETYAAGNSFQVEILSTTNFNVLASGADLGSVQATASGNVTITLPSLPILRERYGIFPNTNYYLRVVATNSSDPNNIQGSLIRFSIAVVNSQAKPKIFKEVEGLQLCKARNGSPFWVGIEGYNFDTRSSYEYWLLPMGDTSAANLARIERDINSGNLFDPAARSVLPATQILRRTNSGGTYGQVTFPSVGGGLNLNTANAWAYLTQSDFLVLYMRERVDVRSGSGCQSQLSLPVIFPVTDVPEITISDIGLTCISTADVKNIQSLRTSEDPIPNTNYTWTVTQGVANIIGENSNSFVSPQYEFTQLGVVVIRVRAENNCGVDTDDTEIIVNPRPSVTVTASTAEACPRDTLMLIARNASIGAIRWSWRSEPTGQFVGQATRDTVRAVLPTGQTSVRYIVTGSVGDCSDSDTITVALRPAPEVSITRSQNILTATAGFSSYQWFRSGQAIAGATSNQLDISIDGLGNGDYSVLATNGQGCSTTTPPAFYSLVGIADMLEELGTLTVYPNPYRESTSIKYTLMRSSDVSVEVFDLLGNRIAQLQDGMQSAGDYDLRFSAAALGHASGIYLLKVSVNGESQSFRLIEIE